MADKLVLKAVTRTFGATVAVESVDLNVVEGEITAILGPSGCGKTTLLMMIAGLQQPTKGRLFINGTDVTDVPANKRRIGVVFQSYALFPHMTVKQNILFGLQNQKMPNSERLERLKSVLELTRLVDLAGRYPNQLSGGQQQRVSLARALALEPALILLDEPFSNLDAKVREQVRVELGQFLRRIGATAILVTHDQEDAAYICDRVVVMRAGRVEQVGTFDDLYRNPKSGFVADFLGQSNWIAGTVTASQGSTATVSVAGAPWQVSTPDSLPIGTEAFIMVRRNALRNLRSESDAAIFETTTVNRLVGRLQKVVHMGPKLLAWIQVGERLLPFEAPAAGSLIEGSQVQAELQPELCLGFAEGVNR